MKDSIQARLRAHMGKAEIPDILPDCREAADIIDALVRHLHHLATVCCDEDALRLLDSLNGGVSSPVNQESASE